MTKLDGRFNPTLPGAVVVNGGSRHPLSGFLPSAHQPLAVGNPNEGLRNCEMLRGFNDQRFEKSLALSNKLDRGFVEKYDLKKSALIPICMMTRYAYLKSQDLQAFDLSEEPEALRNSYGDDHFGQGVLLAADWLNDKFVSLKCNSVVGIPTKQLHPGSGKNRHIGPSAIGSPDDLNNRGMLDETLIVLATEFGRTPNINVNEGRDHYPKAFSCMLAGGGIRGGQVWGKTDDEGRGVTDQRVEIPDFNATIAYCLGLPLDEIIYSPTRRPFTLSDKGNPLVELI